MRVEGCVLRFAIRIRFFVDTASGPGRVSRSCQLFWCCSLPLAPNWVDSLIILMEKEECKVFYAGALFCSAVRIIIMYKERKSNEQVSKIGARIITVTYQQLGNLQWSAGVLAQTQDRGSIVGLDRHDRNMPSCLRR